MPMLLADRRNETDRHYYESIGRIQGERVQGQQGDNTQDRDENL